MKFINKSTGVVAEVTSDFLIAQYKNDKRYKVFNGKTDADADAKEAAAKAQNSNPPSDQNGNK